MPTRLLAGVVVFALAGATMASAQDVTVILTFNGAADGGVVVDVGGTIDLATSSLVVAKVPPGKLAALALDPRIASIEEDAEVALAGVGSLQVIQTGAWDDWEDPNTSQLTPWGIDRIDAPAVWPVSTGAGVRVAIVDTGITSTHADFKDANGFSRVVLGPNFLHKNVDSSDDHGHGTMVAGVVGAGNNGYGVVGVAPDCTLISVKVLSRRGYAGLGPVAAGIEWAADNADVINASLATDSDSAAIRRAVDRAVANGVVVCGASGNSGDATLKHPLYPGAYPEVITASATDEGDQVPFWSSRGTYVDLGAPGVYIISTYRNLGPGDWYALWEGTSFACPHVAGTAALLIGSGVTSAADIRARLEGTADDINAATLPGIDLEIGRGLVDAEEAVTGVQSLP